MRKRKKGWMERHAVELLTAIIFVQFLIIFWLVISPCPAPIRPADMPKVTPQIKPPYQWGQKA